MKKQATDVTLPECQDEVPFDVDYRAKLLPKRHNSAQGDGMGLRGMSLLGGQYHHALRATGSDAVYPERHQIHAVLDHTSKQGVDDTMRAIEAMLEELASTTTTPIRVRIRSDKCNNFCTYAWIPFIVEGNARGWRRDGGKGLITVASWTFSEAQMGKVSFLPSCLPSRVIVLPFFLRNLSGLRRLPSFVHFFERILPPVPPPAFIFRINWTSTSVTAECRSNLTCRGARIY
jgi:hypothetical protein